MSETIHAGVVKRQRLAFASDAVPASTLAADLANRFPTTQLFSPMMFQPFSRPTVVEPRRSLGFGLRGIIRVTDDVSRGHKAR